jgi:transcriptional regulator with XRE-family HTH domain
MILELNQKIVQARRQARLSQQALGNMVGVSDKAISAYEVGRSSPPIKVLKKISQATNQPLSFFLQPDELVVADLIMAKLDGVEGVLRELREELKELKRTNN